MTTAATIIETHTLEIPGVVLTYDVRPGSSSAEPALVLIGSPMGAAGFGTLASHFADRTVVTYDPRPGGIRGQIPRGPRRLAGHRGVHIGLTSWK